MNMIDFKSYKNVEDYVSNQKMKGYSEEHAFKEVVDFLESVSSEGTKNMIIANRKEGISEREIYQRVTSSIKESNVIESKSNGSNHLNDDKLSEIAAKAANKGRRMPYGRG